MKSIVRVHEDLIRSYALDCITFDEPWKLYWVRKAVGEEWVVCDSPPTWDVELLYKREPDRFDDNGAFLMRTKLPLCRYVYTINITNNKVRSFQWRGTLAHRRLLVMGLVFPTEKLASAYQGNIIDRLQRAGE